MTHSGPLNLITDVPGIRVGNARNALVRSGVTVILPDQPVIMGVDIRGGAPGTRDTPALEPDCLVEDFHGLVLCGGSVFGLDAAGAVTSWLSRKSIGLDMGPVAVPVVPAAVLFDLANGGDKNWGTTPPYADLGRKACEKADINFEMGNAGAGYGALAGAIQGGLGSASAQNDDGLIVGALVAVNSFGSVTMPGTKALWALSWEQEGEFAALCPGVADYARHNATLELETPKKPQMAGNTTIGVIATNARLTKAQAKRVAIMAQDGIARAIRPVHTPYDGDTIFVMATGEYKPEEEAPLAVTRIGNLAADCLTRAIVRGVLSAETLGDVKSYRDST